jgi:hypothetical protein
MEERIVERYVSTVEALTLGDQLSTLPGEVRANQYHQLSCRRHLVTLVILLELLLLQIYKLRDRSYLQHHRILYSTLFHRRE